MNKKALGRLVAECYGLFGATKTAEVIDSVKRLGYHYACIAGMTVAISDVIVPPAKREILAATSERVKRVEQYYSRGIMTEKERYDKVCALWSEATDLVADAMMANMDEFNPIYMMSDSGARGNKQQMRQLAGMRGLMADPSGKIIDLPITANFREGLSVSDYFISSHGARKGLADTALRTADSGYLTRRLVDVAQDVIVREYDCDISAVNLMLVRAQLAEDTFDALEILQDSLIDRVLAEDIYNVDSGELALAADTILDAENLIKIGETGVSEISLRGTNLTEPFMANHSRVVEVIALGTREASRREKLRHDFIHEQMGKELARPLEFAGMVIAAGEHLTHEVLDALLDDEEVTELYIRNNNIRGIEVEAITEGRRGVIESLRDRIIGRNLAEDIYDADGSKIASINERITERLADKICGSRKLVVADPVRLIGQKLAEDVYAKVASTGDEITLELAEKICALRDEVAIAATASLIGQKLAEDIPGVADSGAEITLELAEKICSVRDKVKVAATAQLVGQKLAEEISEKIGTLGAQIDEELAAAICETREEVMIYRDKVLIRSVLTCKSSQGVCIKCYGEDLANRTEVEIGEAVGIIAAQSIGEPGTQLTMRTFHTGGVAGGDITQGLPRVEELFEARKPKNAAIIAEIDGSVSWGEPDKNGLRVIVITPEDSENQNPREYSIPFGINPLVKAGDFIHAGDNITDGAKNPHDILRICGLKETHRYLVKEVQKVYKSQGVEINDKHIEVMDRDFYY